MTASGRGCVKTRYASRVGSITGELRPTIQALSNLRARKCHAANWSPTFLHSLGRNRVPGFTVIRFRDSVQVLRLRVTFPELCAQSCNRPGLILPSKPDLLFASASDTRSRKELRRVLARGTMLL